MSPGSPARDASEDAEARASRLFTYACFTYIGLFAPVGALLEALPLSFATSQGIGMLIGIPASVVALAASAAGIGLTLVRWREWPLLTMSGALLTMLAVFVIRESGSSNRVEYAAQLNAVITVAVVTYHLVLVGSLGKLVVQGRRRRFV